MIIGLSVGGFIVVATLAAVYIVVRNKKNKNKKSGAVAPNDGMMESVTDYTEADAIEMVEDANQNPDALLMQLRELNPEEISNKVSVAREVRGDAESCR